MTTLDIPTDASGLVDISLNLPVSVLNTIDAVSRVAVVPRDHVIAVIMALYIVNANTPALDTPGKAVDNGAESTEKTAA